jgi:hypothetical protein
MNNELQPQSEILAPERPKFGGRPKGARNLITREMREQFQAYFEDHGPDANPLIGLAEIARNREVSPATRARAWHDLAKFVVPALLLSQKDPETESPNGTLVIEALQSLLKPAPPLEIQGASSDVA